LNWAPASLIALSSDVEPVMIALCIAVSAVDAIGVFGDGGFCGAIF